MPIFPNTSHVSHTVLDKDQSALNHYRNFVFQPKKQNMYKTSFLKKQNYHTCLLSQEKNSPNKFLEKTKLPNMFSCSLVSQSVYYVWRGVFCGKCLCTLRGWGKAKAIGLAPCAAAIAVKHVDERRSARAVSLSLDQIPFNQFIEENNLVDLPLHGRQFTWFKGDGLSMSRLDRFLLSEEWCFDWSNCKQVARLRSLYDHCALVLAANEEDWGPRPSRMLKCWRYIPGYHVFVIDKWNSFQVTSWVGYVLKENLKLIKAALKEWHMNHAQNLPSRIEAKKDRLQALDQKGEEDVL
jgi:hypothetical protein